MTPDAGVAQPMDVDALSRRTHGSTLSSFTRWPSSGVRAVCAPTQVRAVCAAKLSQKRALIVVVISVEFYPGGWAG